ncbi:MAG: hypothetical protein V7744_20715 [Pseudomonadales bacterium]
MHDYRPPTASESGGPQFQPGAKTIQHANSANNGGTLTPLTMDLPAASAIFATAQAGKTAFEIITNPEPLSPHQQLDVFMALCLLLPDDKEFLLRLLPVSAKQRKDVTQRYKAEFLVGVNAEPTDHKKQNAGRFRANSWLRQIDKTGI